MNRLLLATLLFAVPFALTVWDIEDKISASYPALGPALGYLPIVAFGLLVMFIVIIMIELLGMATQAFYRLLPSRLAHMACKVARADDIPQIVAIAQKTMGDRITEENTRQLYNHNTKSIRKVVDTRNGSIVGYFCILPLTVNGQKNVMERDLIGDSLQVENFTKTFRPGSPVYIGSIAGINQKGKAATLELAQNLISTLDVPKAFTRPVTKDGVRIVKKFGFRPVSEHDPLTKEVYVMKIRDAA